MENETKRMIYRSKNRGCKEMDIVLGNFAAGGINLLNANELNLYSNLLEEADNDIWDWISSKEQTPEKYSDLIRKIATYGTK